MTDLCKLTIRTHTANALYQRFETNISRIETARPCSQVPHSCICERFIYSHARSVNAIQQNGRTDRGNILIAHRYMDVELGGRAVSFLGLFVSYCRYSAEETNSSTTMDNRAIGPLTIVCNITAAQPVLYMCTLYNSVSLMLYLEKRRKHLLGQGTTHPSRLEENIRVYHVSVPILN